MCLYRDQRGQKKVEWKRRRCWYDYGDEPHHRHYHLLWSAKTLWEEVIGTFAFGEKCDALAGSEDKMLHQGSAGGEVDWSMNFENCAGAVQQGYHAQATATPLVIWSYHARSAGAAMGPLRRALARPLLRQARCVAGMGRQARDVLRELGAPSLGIFDAPNAHDREQHRENHGD